MLPAGQSVGDPAAAVYAVYGPQTLLVIAAPWGESSQLSFRETLSGPASSGRRCPLPRWAERGRSGSGSVRCERAADAADHRRTLG